MMNPVLIRKPTFKMEGYEIKTNVAGEDERCHHRKDTVMEIYLPVTKKEPSAE